MSHTNKTTMEKTPIQYGTISHYRRGHEVRVLMETLNGNGKEWRKGWVVDIKHVTPDKGGTPYSYPIVEVERTYYRKLKDRYEGIVWVGEDFELYNKLNREGFLNEDEIYRMGYNYEVKKHIPCNIYSSEGMGKNLGDIEIIHEDNKYIYWRQVRAYEDSPFMDMPTGKIDKYTIDIISYKNQ